MKKKILHDVHGAFRSRFIANIVDGVSKSFTSSIGIGLIALSKQRNYGKKLKQKGEG